VSAETFGTTIDAGASVLRGIVADTLVGTPLSEFRITLSRLSNRLVHNEPVKSAVEMAAMDAVGRGAGLPVYALLGGLRQRTLPTVTILTGDTVDAVVEDAVRAVEEGMRRLKLKFGTRPIAQDLEMLRRVRERVGPDIRLYVDANLGYSVIDALSVARGLDVGGVDYFEQPVDAADVEGMARIARACGVPLCADEGVFTATDVVAHHRAGSAGVVSVKLAKAGGLEPGRLALQVARQLGMHAFLSGKVAESSIATAAQIHVAASLDGATEVSGTTLYLAADVTSRSVLPIDGAYTVSDRPGLGVEVDEAALAEYAWRG
jgi:L-alanine-DL-glutamate epimerase-like enolase superfamily enzyme